MCTCFPDREPRMCTDPLSSLLPVRAFLPIRRSSALSLSLARSLVPQAARLPPFLLASRLRERQKKMPAILVASKMKSGLPKPVHSAVPILQIPAQVAAPQPCALKLGGVKPTYSSQIPLKSPQGHEREGDGAPGKRSTTGGDTQVRDQLQHHASLQIDCRLPLSYAA